MMDTPTSHPGGSGGHGLANTLKNPKALAIVGVLALGFMLYFRSRNGRGNLQSTDGSGTAVTDPNASYYPDPTQGAADPGAGQGNFGGFDTPTEPDWMTVAPSWLTDAPSWYTNPPAPGGSEPPPTNSSNPISVPPGGSVYDNGHIYTAPGGVTGGSPPNSTSKQTPPKKDHSAKGAVAVVHTNSSGNKNDGKTYIVVKNPKGHPKGTYHVYGTGKNAQYVRMS